MKLTKKEQGMVRYSAYYVNSFKHNLEKTLTDLLSKISEKKQVLAEEYFHFLTSNEGKKSFVVDFLANGAGNLTFHDCTYDEAHKQCLYSLQNGAFGKSEKLEDITITGIAPATLNHNSYDDFLLSKGA